MALLDLLNVESFFELTLTPWDFLTIGLLFAALLLAVCMYARLACAEQPKKMAWVVTMVSALFATVCSAIYLLVRVPQFGGFFLLRPDKAIFYGVDNVSAIVCLWIAMANTTDLIFGFLCYAKYLDPLTAYVHHTLYIWMMPTCTTGNGGFLIVEKFAPAFVFGLIEELPTFILAFGYIFPAFRTDLGFGLTFLVLRIGFHAYMLLYAVITEIQTTVLTLYSITLIMHCYWFALWVRSYRAKMIAEEKKRLAR